MPSSTRRARERASTRDRIIESALYVLESEGAAALTIRRIAAEVEYSAPVVYQHFANKDALVVELVTHGYGLLLASFEKVVGESDADRRLLLAASAYVRFAREHPHLYEAMNGSVVDPDGRRRAAEPTIDVLKELLTTWAAAHSVILPDPDEACEIVWGTLYGMASLGYLRPERAEQALHAILRGWRAGG
ncbi:TetR/AcrR family transcriptional regulator [Catenuloplanes sp. NPDC051500]|uniref:TetR/AcrR family transcriptional regulator n=1 Tax=Catenuloplanes sp. NPDC051500 TaxID=3363959 RepID=UPI00379868DD